MLGTVNTLEADFTTVEFFSSWLLSPQHQLVSSTAAEARPFVLLLLVVIVIVINRFYSVTPGAAETP
jgi:hypothetical protein